jgi:MoxR-like ATPase
MVEQVCAKLKRPLIRVNLNMMTDEDQLIGTKTLVNGNIQIVEGPVLLAMKHGYILLLDELDAANSNTILCMQPILEGKPYYFKLNNTIIHPAPGFNIFATANTKGKGSDDGRYIGTNILNEAFLERFAIVLEQGYPSITVEIQILEKAMHGLGCSDTSFLADLVKWAAAIRKTFADGGVEETITTRRLLHIVKAYVVFGKITKAIELCCNRFDAATKAGFIDLYKKISSVEESEITEDNLDTNS